MPSLFKFLMVLGTSAAIVYAGLFVLAVYFEPKPKEIRKTLPSVTIRKD